MTPDNRLNKTKIIKYLWVLGLFFSLFIFYSLFQNFKFHLVSVTPSLNSVGVVTPDITFNYNHALVGKGLLVTSDQNIISSYSASGKKLTMSLDSAKLSLGRTYTITVGPVSDLSGKFISKKSYNFIVKNIAFASLSKEQQTTIMKQQATVPYSRTSIGYINTDALINVGLSANQLLDMQQAFFLYSKSIDKEISQVTVMTDSLVLGPYDSNSPNPISSLIFNVKIDSTELGAKLVYSGLSTAELYLYDQVGGKQLFDSGLLTPASF